MTITFDVNNSKGADDYAGRMLFDIKEAMVASGWTVRGSGDGGARLAYDGVTAALPGGQQGSGGAYDCWMTGTTRNDSTPATAGDAGNASAWVVLECGTNPRQVLLQMTTGTGVAGAGWSSYANVLYNPGITDAFDGSVATATAAPGAATDELALFGSRDSTGAPIATYTAAGYYHVWASDVACADSTFSWGYIFVLTGDTTTYYQLGIAGVDPTSASSSDEDPVFVFASGTAPGLGAGPSGSVWSSSTNLMATAYAAMGLSTPFLGDGTAFGGEEAYGQYFLADAAGDDTIHGLIDLSAMACDTVGSRPWGDIGTDQYGAVYVTWGGGSGVLTPWPSAATNALPGTSATFTLRLVNPDPTPTPTVNYIQRVWSSGLSAWCYYTQTAINPTPLSGDTTPNWTGAISGHEVLGSY